MIVLHFLDEALSFLSKKLKQLVTLYLLQLGINKYVFIYIYINLHISFNQSIDDILWS